MTSKYWCRKDFQFQKAVETHHAKPPQVRAMVWEKKYGPTGCWSEAVQELERGAGAGRWRRSSGANSLMGWHRQWAESEEILLSRETESIRMGGENQKESQELQENVEAGYLRRMCRHLPFTPSALLQATLPQSLVRSLDSGACIARGSCAHYRQLVSSNGSHLEKIRGQA